jgi:hypothetical protein
MTLSNKFINVWKMTNDTYDNRFLINYLHHKLHLFNIITWYYLILYIT